MAFEKGQKIVCVNAGPNQFGKDAEGKLTVGKEYIVLSVEGGNGVRVLNDKDLAQLFFANRFKAVEKAQAIMRIPAEAVGVKIKCVDPLRGSGLRKNAVYTIKSIGANTYCVEDIPGKAFKKSRFEIVPLELPKAPVEARKLQDGDLVEVIDMTSKQGSYTGWIGVLKNHPERIKTLKIKDLNPQDLAYNRYSDLARLVWEGCDGDDWMYIPRNNLRLKQEKRVLKVGDKVIPYKKVETKLGWNAHMDEIVQKGNVHVIENIKTHRTGFPYAKLVGTSWVWPISSLKFEDGTPCEEAPLEAQAIPPKPAEPSVEEYLAEARKKVGPGSNAVCSFAWKCKEQKPKIEMSPACYAPIRYVNTPLDYFVFSLGNGPKYIKNYYNNGGVKQEDLKRWNEYVLYRSPFSEAFIKEEYDVQLEKGVQADLTKNISQILAAAIAIRVGFEYKDKPATFVHFVDQGYGENTAFLMAHIVQWVEQAKSFTKLSFAEGGHTCMVGDASYKSFIKFFQQGFHEDTKQGPANEHMSGYQIHNAVAQHHAGQETMLEHVANNMKSTKVGEGFNAKAVLTNETVYDYAEQLNKLIN